MNKLGFFEMFLSPKITCFFLEIGNNLLLHALGGKTAVFLLLLGLNLMRAVI